MELYNVHVLREKSMSQSCLIMQTVIVTEFYFCEKYSILLHNKDAIFKC